MIDSQRLSVEMASFTEQLVVNATSSPVTMTGDPIVNGYNVWPTNSVTFVPGNPEYGGFKKTWTGKPVPIEMLSCSSTTGDWLHVELWKIDEESSLAKIYTFKDSF